MGRLDEDSGGRPSCLWLPLVTGRWMLTVVFDNCGEIIREYPRCVRWSLSRCIHFDTGNDAWRDQVSIHAAREKPKFSACLAFRVRLFCILAEQKLSCCNPRAHGSARRQRAADADERSAGDLRRFPLVARDCPTRALGRRVQLRRVRPKIVPLKVPMARSAALRR
jgi:hypothetical protein